MQARGWKGRRFTASFGGVAKKSGLQNRWAWCLSHALRFGQVLHGPPVYSWVFSWLACRLGCPGYLLWWSRLAAANCRHHAVQLALGKCRLLQRGQKLMTMPGQVRTIENPETLPKKRFRELLSKILFRVSKNLNSLRNSQKKNKNISFLSLRAIFWERRESEDTREKSIFLLFRQNIPLGELIQGKIV